MHIDLIEQVDGHLHRNGALKKSLQDKGVDIKEKRSIDLHFWAATKEDAAMLAKALYDSGLLILTLAPASSETKDQWDVEAGLSDSVENLTERSNVRKYVELAAKFNAVYDGWGTLV